MERWKTVIHSANSTLYSRIVPVLLYSCESWELNYTTTKKICGFHAWCMKWIFNTDEPIASCLWRVWWWHTPNGTQKMLAVAWSSLKNTKRETNQPSLPFQSPTTTTVQEGLSAGTVSMVAERSRDGGKRPAEIGEEVWWHLCMTQFVACDWPLHVPFN